MTKGGIIESCDRIRGNLGAIDAELLNLKESTMGTFLGRCGTTESDIRARGEAAANFMLAHRHLEDARMRCGKVIQALEGGVSILDHPKVRALIDEIRRADA